MKIYPIIQILTFSTGIILVSCNHKIKTGDELSSSEISYLNELGILDKEEKIKLFDSQSDFKTSGNFFSNKRIASYWIDKKDTTKNSIDFGYYTDIDTILTKDLTRSLTYASYLQVIKKNGKKFKIYVDGDSSAVHNFFNLAILEWKKTTGNKVKHKSSVKHVPLTL